MIPSIIGLERIPANSRKENPFSSVVIDVIERTLFDETSLVNFDVIEKLTKLVSSKRVRSITSITTLEKGFSFREFAGILSSPMIDGIMGNGTGTNTHFATACDLPSMSIERSVD